MQTNQTAEVVRYFSNSELKTWKRCRREWALSYFMQVQPWASVGKLTGHLALGRRVHAALQAAREGGDALATLHAQAERERAQISGPVALLADVADGPADVDLGAMARAELAHEHAAEIELAEIMVSGYLEWLEETGVDAGTVLVGTERKVEADIGVLYPSAALPGARVVIRGRIDTSVDLPSGQRAVQDYKTAQDLTRARKVQHLEEQWLFYMLLEYLSDEREGRAVYGVLVDQLRKVKRTKTAKPPFYGRDLVTHNRQRQPESSDVERRRA